MPTSFISWIRIQVCIAGLLSVAWSKRHARTIWSLRLLYYDGLELSEPHLAISGSIEVAKTTDLRRPFVNMKTGVEIIAEAPQPLVRISDFVSRVHDIIASGSRCTISSVERKVLSSSLCTMKVFMHLNSGVEFGITVRVLRGPLLAAALRPVPDCRIRVRVDSNQGRVADGVESGTAWL